MLKSSWSDWCGRVEYTVFMAEYKPQLVEADWQQRWAEAGVWRVADAPGKPKQYVLDMFPYPSGDGLHVGHVKGYIATDVYARFRRMQGYAVLHPMGWDAFGLPAENYALANKVHPRVAVERNIVRFKRQLMQLGFTYDWDREINTTDSAYYEWTQWIFIQLFKKGLAYESHEPINWCPSCQTGLANEDVEAGRCERCGTAVEKKRLRQWVLKITDYAERLLADLEQLDWPESIKKSQRSWIGRSEGSILKFQISNAKFQIDVFTTRADTLFGATYLVMAPENPIVASLLNSKAQIPNSKEVEDYIREAERKTDLVRQAEEREKTGVELKGVVAVNPASGEELPVWVADYILMSYGTGAIMAVPAHDERDFAFAQKFGLPIRRVIAGGELPYTGAGNLMNSGEFTGVASEEAKLAITEKVGGRKRVMYKLRDWVFSRQRYWGEPIPIIHCVRCGPVAVPESDLPVELPEVEYYEPTGTGESPLAAIDEWVSTTCPQCGGAGKRETNTMPQWAGSSWYYLRYLDPKNQQALVGEGSEQYWMPVDMYVGGAEHATRHLIYARFWHKFLQDIGVVHSDEPFVHLQNVGLVLGADGRKMSKRWGNVINPDDVVARHGADALRVYEMFMGPFGNAMLWSDESLAGAARFLRRVRGRFTSPHSLSSREERGDHAGGSGVGEVVMHRTIKRVTEAIEQFRFNTGVAALMEWLNELEPREGVDQERASVFVRLLAPYAPHLAEELWAQLGCEAFVVDAPWPEFNAELLARARVVLPVQVNGRLRGQVEVAADARQSEVEAAARVLPNVARHAPGPVRQVVYVPGRVINFIV